jgi:hypothetical protein
MPRSAASAARRFAAADEAVDARLRDAQANKRSVPARAARATEAALVSFCAFVPGRGVDESSAEEISREDRKEAPRSLSTGCRDHTLDLKNSEGFERVIENECLAIFAFFAILA